MMQTIRNCSECLCYSCWNYFPCYEDHTCECYCNACDVYYNCNVGHTCDPNGGGDSQTEANKELFVDTVLGLVGLPYVYGANGPNSFDCSSTICYGLRQINTAFGDYSANQLYNLFTVPSTSYGRGTLVFYDYTSDGIIDHVTTLLGDGNMIHPSSGSGVILNVSSSYLDGYTSTCGGTIYYQEINWNSVNQ